MEKILNLDYHQNRWTDSNLSAKELIDFEDDIISHWENGEIRGPIHLSNGNEEQLIKIFSKIAVEDWVFSTWRSHYHALLHGVEPSVLKQKILDGKSITIVDKECKFYSSAIVTGTLPIVLDVRGGNTNKNPQYGSWETYILSPSTQTQVLIPPGFANGHYVMEKNSIFYYKLAYEGEFVDVDKQKTIKWNSKKFNIEWPCTNPIISKRDRNGKDS